MNFSVKMETKRFNAAMKKHINEVKGPKRKLAVKKIAFALVREMVTPHGGYRHPTLTGRARAGWHAAFSKLGSGWEEAGNDPAAVEEGKRLGEYREGKQGSLFFVDLVNGVHYILFLEYGASNQAPAGMLRYNMRRISGEFVPLYLNEIRESWNRHFD